MIRLAFEDVLRHGVAVDGVEQRPAHSDVVEPGIVAAQVEPGPGRRAGQHFALALLFPLLAQDRRAVEGNRAAHAEIHFAGQHRGQIGVGVFDGFESHPVDFWPAQDEVIEGFQLHAAALIPLDDFKRTGADKVFIPVRQIGERLHVAGLKSVEQQVARKGAHMGVLNRVGFIVEIVPVNHDGAIVGGLDLGNHLRHQAIRHGKFGMLGDLPAELEILRGVRLAVMPLEIGPQLVDRDHGLLLHVDLPSALLDRRQLLGQHRHPFQSHRILRRPGRHRPSRHARSRAGCDNRGWSPGARRE